MKNNSEIAIVYPMSKEFVEIIKYRKIMGGNCRKSAIPAHCVRLRKYVRISFRCLKK